MKGRGDQDVIDAGIDGAVDIDFVPDAAAGDEFDFRPAGADHAT